MQLELSRVERALQIGAQLEAGQHARVHLGLEQPVAALPVSLGDVHRRIRVANQLVRASRRGGLEHRDADAAAQQQLLARRRQRAVQVLERPLGDLDDRAGAIEILEQHHELVAAEAGRGVA